MSDDAKDAAIVIIGLALLAGLINRRAEHAIEHDLARSLTFQHGGMLHADVEPRGMLGMLAGQAGSVTVTGKRFAAQGLAFRVQRGSGLRAYTQRLEFDFRDISLRGVVVERFLASFPDVSLDAGRALFDERIILRSAGQGRAEATVGAAALQRFAARRFPQFRDLVVTLRLGVAEIAADVPFVGRVLVTMGVAVRDGRYLVAADPHVSVSGRPMPPNEASLTLARLDPLIDLDADLGLGGTFRATQVEIGEGTVTVRGDLTVPRVR